MKFKANSLLIIFTTLFFLILIIIFSIENSIKTKLYGNLNYYSTINKLPNFQLSFSKENMATIEGQLAELLKIPRNIPYTGEKMIVNGKLNYQNQVFPISAKIHGMYNDHWKEKYSLKINLKKDKKILDLYGFILLRPVTRFFLGDWIGGQFEKEMNQLSLKRTFISASINSKWKKTYLVEESFKGLAKKHKDSLLIFSYKIINDSVLIKPYKKNYNEELKLNIEKKLTNFIAYPTQNELLNQDNFATYYAINDICQGFHQLVEFNTHLYYNYNTNLISPIGREWNSLNYVNKYEKILTSNYVRLDSPHFPPSKLHLKIFETQNFKIKYFSKLNELSKIDLDYFFQKRKSKIDLYNHCLWKDMGKLKYDFDYLYDNLTFISNSLQ